MKHVVIGILYKNHHLCVAKRLSEPFKGYIECPGGKVELDETLEDALKRELFEEINLQNFEYQYLREILVLNEHGSFTLHFYKITSNEECTPKVYTELLWVHRDQIETLNWIPHNLPYIDFFKQVDQL